MNYDAMANDTDNRISSPHKQLPMLVMRGSPQEVQLLGIHFRDVDRTAYKVRWNGIGINDDFGWSACDFVALLPVEPGYYIWNAGLNRFSLLSSDGWSKAAAKLVEMRKADLFQENISQAVADGIESGARKAKAKPKRNGSTQLLGADAEYLQDMKANSRF